MPPDDETPPSEPESTDDADAEAFANEWVEYKGKVDSIHDLLESIMGTANDEEPPAPTPPAQPRTPARQQTQKGRRPSSPVGPTVDSPPIRQPDTKPEESHWYWKPRWKRGG